MTVSSQFRYYLTPGFEESRMPLLFLSWWLVDIKVHEHNQSQHVRTKQKQGTKLSLIKCINATLESYMEKALLTYSYKVS